MLQGNPRRPCQGFARLRENAAVLDGREEDIMDNPFDYGKVSERFWNLSWKGMESQAFWIA